MAESATDDEIAKIKDLASDPSKVMTVKTVEYDLMSLGLTKDDACLEIVDWIDADGRVKPTTLHSFAGKVGERAFEMKPTINSERIYIKVTIEPRPLQRDELLVISFHRDH